MFGLFSKKDQKRPVATILVVEDSEGDRALIQRTLEKRNYSVILVNDGETGLKVAREHEVDLVILDYLLPGMNGLEVCQILKEGKKTRGIPIIFLTVVESGEAILECYGSGAESYMHKPIDSRLLVKEVRTLLSEARSRGPDEDE